MSESELQKIARSCQWLRTHSLQRLHIYRFNCTKALSPETIQEVEKYNQQVELLQEMIRQDYNWYKRNYKKPVVLPKFLQQKSPAFKQGIESFLKNIKKP